ncbi:DNA mismatch repair endonuclease MutL [Rhodocaloribacter litoris]|uniref:DNA mismatch repair endonuclease MutL n=1 Tax=Rhodocaloribacter litoris TaxID=2558931 RepID=UPI00141E3CD5|nr:DNA mismatch repair endonuclease MutL [Rhodocaloribacter litoris]QXD15714.1 DNA mismatch repair endonuclease MutL [Rhodocaloribacter litoris]
MPDSLANKIAAGEVVQRPASAAKELIENALDAGASQVTVLLKAAGRELVQVIDDGCGMGPADAVTCFQRHATSKIRTAEDLERILTLGFRGEALASIAAVAQVELRTKRATDAAGLCVRVEGGRLVAKEPCATPDGTSVAVRNLFYNVPARRNFLKSPATEFKHLVETFQFLALSHPNVGFTLIHDDNEVYRLAAAPSDDPFEALRHRVAALFGKEYEEHLVPVEETTSYLSVYGFVGAPSLRRRSRGEQFLFVNGRYVRNRYLEHAVATAYGDALPEGAHPFFTLFLNLDPRHVDVNVHPTKAEVKFDDERGVYGFLRAVVKKGLGTAALTPEIEPAPTGAASFPAAPRPFVVPWEGARPATDPEGASFPARPAGRGTRSDAPRPGELTERLYRPAPGTDDAEGAVIASGATASDLEDETPDREPLLWQLHDAYILTQIRSGLMIVDQNAAHERILYEKALQNLRGGFGLSQQLLFPHTLDFSPADYELLTELLPDLRSLGFDLEPFGGRSVVVRGVPAEIRTGDERSILEDILDAYKTFGDTGRDRRREALAKSIARRSAIKPGVKLSTKEMRTLIDQLFLCEMPYACPQGRPTMVKIAIEELQKRFGRA